MKRQVLGLIFALSMTVVNTTGAGADDLPRLNIRLKSSTPLPRAEVDLPSIEAKAYSQIEDSQSAAECPTFDDEGALAFCDAIGDATRQGIRAFAVGRDKRIYVAEEDVSTRRGSIMSLAPDGSDLKTVIPAESGFDPEFLIIDSNGGIYFTHVETGENPRTGGVYYLPPGKNVPVLVTPRLPAASGVGLAPGEKTLWIIDRMNGLLLKQIVSERSQPHLTSVVYRFVSGSPETLCVDSDGNVYVGLSGQGRIMVFNALGYPIAQFLLPGRDEGHNLRPISIAIRPGTDNLVIRASDGDRDERYPEKFRAHAVAVGLPATAVSQH